MSSFDKPAAGSTSMATASGTPIDIQKENEELLTPDGLARWIWRYLVGCPITPPYDTEYLHMLDNVKRLDRAAFTKGLHEARRQYKERDEAIATQTPDSSVVTP